MDQLETPKGKNNDNIFFAKADKGNGVKNEFANTNEMGSFHNETTKYTHIKDDEEEKIDDQ